MSGGVGRSWDAGEADDRYLAHPAAADEPNLLPEAIPEQLDEGDEGDALDDLVAGLAGLNARLEEAQRLHGRQSDLVERLHDENQSLRAGELRAAQLPLIRDLLRLHDDLERLRVAAGDGSGAGDLAIVQETLLDLLARNGIEHYSPEPGDPFDAGSHSVVGVELTADQALDRAITEVVRPGFRWEAGDTIRVADVRAYSCREQMPQESTES